MLTTQSREHYCLKLQDDGFEQKVEEKGGIFLQRREMENTNRL